MRKALPIFFALCLFPMACASIPDREIAPEGDAIIAGDNAEVPSASARWWEEFNDQDLSTLIDRALANNYDLRSRWDRLAEAEAQAKLDGVDLKPTLEARAGGNISKTFGDASPNEEHSFNLGLFASYEFDLWGRMRAAAQSSLLEVKATEEDLRAAAVSLAAEVALRWFEYQSFLGEIRLLEEEAVSNRKRLEVLRVHFANGLAMASDIMRQENSIESNLETIAALKRDAEVRAIQVATLIGVKPDELQSKDFSKGQLPALQEVAKTIELSTLRRRHDLKAAYTRALAQDRNVAEAIANRYPRFSISAGVETRGQAKDLFDNWIFSLAGNLVQPLFDGGARKAEISKRQAVLSRTLNEYSSVVLRAVEEVTIVQLEEVRLREIRTFLLSQQKRAEAILERSHESFLNQQIDYIDVLRDVDSLLQFRRELLENQREILATRVALYRATAGAPELQRPTSRADQIQDQETPKE